MPRIQSPLPLCFLALGAASPLTAQYAHRPAPAPFSFGAYAGLGVNSAAQPLSRETGYQVQAGFYGEWARHAWRPGLDLRVAGHTMEFLNSRNFNIFSDSNEHQGSGSEKLIGPRISYARGIVHPYVEGLFGPADDDILQPSGLTAGSHGTLKFAVIGIDFDADTHVQVRAFEYGVGTIGGTTGFLRQTFTTGLVFRFP